MSRGRTYLNLKIHDEAIRDCTASIELDPNNVTALTARGNIYDILDSYEDAYNDYSMAIDAYEK